MPKRPYPGRRPRPRSASPWQGLLVSTPARQARKAAAFAELHAGEPFVIPNPWDAGSARVLAALGFRAPATTSSGFAFTLARRDCRVTLAAVASRAAATDR